MFLFKVKNTLKSVFLFVFLVFILGGCKKTPAVKQESLSLVAGDQHNIAYLLSENVDKYDFVTSDNKVAVCKKGIITAISPGETKLEVKLKKKGKVIAEVVINVVFEEFEITYHLNGGANHAENPSLYTIRDLPLLLQDPSLDGYRFLGWFTAEDFSGERITQISDDSINSYVLYAKWEKIVSDEFTLAYELDGGLLTSDLNKYQEKDLPLTLPIPTKEGYTFKGWYLDANKTNQIATIDKSMGDIVLYAKWEKIIVEYSINYVLNGGLLDNPVNVYHEDILPLNLPIPTKEGYTFMGWFKEEGLINNITTIGKDHKGNITLYAMWEQILEDEYVIYYELNGGSLSSPVNKYSESVLPLTLVDPIREGYNFKGWFTDEGLTNQITTINKGHTGNVVVYAKWEQIPEKEYLIAYELNGGSFLEKAIDRYDESVLPITLPEPTREGYNFKGWFTDEALTKPITSINKGHTGNVLVYARWEQIPETEYSITYNLDGGSLSSPINKYKESMLPLTLGEPTKEGYVFVGWYTESSFTNEIAAINEGTIGALSLYAKWEPINTEYNISYTLNGGSFDYTKEDLKVEFLKDYYEFLKPSVDLNTFMHGEGKNSGFGGIWFSINGDEVIIERLYAVDSKEADASKDYFINQPKYNEKWVPFFDFMENLVNETNPTQHFWSSPYTGNKRLKEFFVGERYADDDRLPNNVANVVAPNKYTPQDIINLINPTRNGYIFSGWYDNPDFQGPVITYIQKGSAGHKTLYAKWVKEGEVEEFTITYNLDGGTLSSPKIKFTANDLPLVLPTPIKNGYKFLGWFTESAFVNKASQISTVGNKVYYAKWEKEVAETYTIYYNLNGGTLNNPVTTYHEGVLPLTLPTPTRAGYAFLGWYTESSLINQLNTINKGRTGNITLYAKWEQSAEVEYSITYNLNGGSLSNPVSIYKESVLPLTLSNPTKDGFVFGGWYKEATFVNKITVINKGTTGNLNLYAKWDSVNTQYTITYNLDGGKFEFTNKTELKDAFLKDFYDYVKPTENLTTFMHGEGKTSGYDGTWHSSHKEKLYVADDKSSDAGKPYFINQPVYNGKWIPFFNLLDVMVKEVNDTQNFWGSTWTGLVRIREYFTGERWADDNRLPSGMQFADKYTIQDEINLIEPKKTGYNFAGWYDNANFDGSKLTKIVKGSSGNKVLYAKWVKVGEEEAFSISYNLAGGTLASPKTKFTAKEIPLTLATPTKSGYKFLGWFTDSTLKTKVTQITSTGNKVLYASWEKIPEYTITYNLDGGTLTNQKTVFTSDDLPYTLPNPTKSGYKFLGWFTDTSFATAITKIDTVGNKLIYAKWEKLDPDKTYTITYNLNGGSLSNPKTSYTIAELPLTLGNPTRANYNFIGWYLNSDFSGSKITKIDSNLVGNINLYARWEISEFTITYELNGGKWLIASKNDLKNDFLKDFYDYVKPTENLTTFMHGSGKTSGYDGTWHSTHKDKLYAANDKSSNASKPYFINQPQYNTKWVPFFDLLDVMVKEVNDTQSFWDSTWTGLVRIKEYFTGERWADDNRMPANLPALQDYHKKYKPETLPLTLPTPVRDGYTFGGWYEKADLSGSSVTTIPAGSTGNKVFYAKWTTLPYNITYNLNGGSWYSSKNDLKNDFLTDFYNYLGKPGGNLTTFMHGAGKTSGYGGTWYDHIDNLYQINDKSSDANKPYFINQPVYNKKWLVFFNYMDTLVKETNAEQSFWTSHYTGCLRLKEYLQETRYQDKTTIPAVVRGPLLYYSGEGLTTLPTPYMSGVKFLGWYDNATFSGSPITSIPKGTTGNKTLYAKWDLVAPPVGSVYLRLNYSGNATLTAGQSVNVSYTAILSDNKYKLDPITWSSSNTKVATVDQNGRVTAVGSGTVIITCKTAASGAVSTVGFTVYGSEISDPLLKYLITQNTGVLFTKNIVYYGYTGNYTNRISNTVNKYLPESLSITSMMLSTSAPNHPNRAMSSIQYVVVHDTGSAGSTSTARANGGWCVNPSNTGSSWHYTTGNDGIFKHINDNMVAWHAGDGSVTFSNRNTGVKATTAKPKVTTSGGYLYFNGTKSVIANSTAINSEGLLVSIGSNGNYYLGPTWVNDGVLVNKGGNSNGIGIEMAVNTGSDAYFTWQRTAKLVADLMTKYGLGLGQVGFHRNFSNKLCPQTLIRAGMQNEFFKLVEAEYMVRKNYSGYTITFTSHNTAIINNHGRIVKYPSQQTNVQYTIKVTKGTTTQSITLNALVPGTKDF